ncbi:hypothetical protein ACWEFJ_24320 [Actinosynnema sp. NPDC004786]
MTTLGALVLVRPLEQEVVVAAWAIGAVPADIASMAAATARVRNAPFGLMSLLRNGGFRTMERDPTILP